ncbi:MAG: di-heme oxidoredictase family protein, partial [Pyrinomonadaceae bacterium]
MKILKLIILALFVGGVVWSMKFTRTVEGRDKSLDNNPIVAEDIAPTQPAQTQAVTEAPTGFDNKTNGFISQADFDAASDTFQEIEDLADGLGPTFNRDGCVVCHFVPVTGGSSDVTELRVGHFDGTNFRDPPGDSLIQEMATDPAIKEVIPPGNEVQTKRISINLLGAGFIEAIDSNTLRAIAVAQQIATGGAIAGQLISVPVLEAGGALRTGRFGHKGQHASLLSFSADAYLNEMGITTRLLPVENTSNGNSVAAFDLTADPEDSQEENDIDAFASFMRALKAPPRDTAQKATAAAQRGASLFNQIGCAICHIPTIQTAPPGTVINGGTFTVPPALGNKIIHNFGDLLLHNVGTGDGIVQE